VTDALAAGVTYFAHVPIETPLDATIAQQLAGAHAVVVPTLAVADGLYQVSHGTIAALADPSLADDVPAEVIAALKNKQLLAFMQTPSYQALSATWLANAKAGVKALLDAGVTIVSGTDAGNPGTFHGLALARELALYVEVGMKPTDALHAATRAAADVLGRSDLGRLEKGALADVVMVTGDATADIGALAHVTNVWKEGAPIDRASLALPKKTSLVLTPTTGEPAGATCLASGECGTGLTCDFSSTCSPSCSTSAQCAKGSSCTQIGAAGYCWQGDGCDPLAQACTNGQACIFLDNAASICWYASPATDGQPCTSTGDCAPGNECDFTSLVCRQICDPKQTSGCPAGKSCIDLSASVGLPVGECQ
jgi:hypothetical protein